MSLSIIIVNYKTAQLIADCLDSIFTFNPAVFEIIIVDNNSNDEIETSLNNKYSNIKFIQMGYNAGFARANNAGISIAQSEHILLLNPDTIIQHNAINNCLDKFAGSDYVACGVQLLNPDGTAQISGNYAMKGGLNYLLPLPYMGWFLKSIATVFGVKKPNVPNATGLVEVDWINGAFLMVKKPAIEKAGLLDEDFFLYAEEAEWCSRLKKVGKLCIYGDEHVIHLQGESAGNAFNSPGKGYSNLFDMKGRQIMVSTFVRIRKEFGVAWFLFNLFFYLITIPIFLIGCILSGLLFRKADQYSFGHWIGFCKNVFVIIKHSIKIIGNRPYFYKLL